MVALCGGLLLHVSGFASVQPKAPALDIQFFGDLFIPSRSLKLTGSTTQQPKIFAEVKPLLGASRLNIANFEGAITPSRQPHILKAYLLPMPDVVVPLMAQAGIHGVTLANNHALDFGLPGMMATIDRLQRQTIPSSGAGLTLDEALRPMVFGTAKGNLCVFSISKTYPEEFWASPSRFGTASPSISQMEAEIRAARAMCQKIFVVFHWGAEGRKTAKDYQRTLARKAIDAGASAVLGHHPHVLQPVEVYKGKPILYSLGNFLFGTVPYSSVPEGMAAGFSFRRDGKLELWLTPLRVDNKVVKFITTPFHPQHLAEGEVDPVAALVGGSRHCQKVLAPLGPASPASAATLSPTRSPASPPIIVRWRCVF